MLVLFFWAWNLAKSYFSGLANFLAIFLGFAKFPLFFWVWQISSYFFGSSNFCNHALESFEWRTHSTEKQNHSSFSYLFKLWQPLYLDSFYFFGFEFWGILFFWVWIWSHSIFLGLNLESFYFFWVVEICSRTSIPVKEMLVCPPSRVDTPIIAGVQRSEMNLHSCPISISSVQNLRIGYQWHHNDSVPGTKLGKLTNTPSKSVDEGYPKIWYSMNRSD